MGLIAVLAAALAAFCGAAVTGISVGGRTVSTALYGLCLLPGVAAAARWPSRRPLPWTPGRLAAAARRVNMAVVAVVVGIGIGTLAVLRLQPSSATVAGLLLLGILPLSLLWPRPGVLRVTVVLSGLSLLGPASLGDDPSAVVGLVAASAVALVAVARLPQDSMGRLGRTPPARTAPLGTWASVVFAVAVLAGLLATRIPPPGSGSGSSLREGARDANGSQAVPFRDELDLAGGGAGAEDGTGSAVLFQVEANDADVWRMQAFDEWTGRTWRQSDQLGQEVPVRGTYIAPSLAGRPFLSRLPFRPLSQRFTVEAAALGVVPAAAEPIQVRTLPPGLRINRLGAIRPEVPLGRGARYVVTSLRTKPTPDDLRASDPATARLVAGDWASYLQPGLSSDRVRSLAAEITAGAPTEYDKVQAVERWLAANVREVKRARAVPDGTDLLDTVLFDDRAATPPVLATAMTVLLRSVGVPARLAVGFLPGERDLLRDAFLVRSRDYHAWVEVGFGSVGWQRFDPSGRTDEAQQADAFLARLLRTLRRLAPVLVAAVLALAALAAGRLVLQRRRQRALPWATRFWDRLVKAGADLGRPREAFETPVDYTGALAASTLPDERMKDVGALVSAAVFSGHEPAAEARTWAEGVLDEAIAAGRRARRRLRRDRRRAARTATPG